MSFLTDFILGTGKVVGKTAGKSLVGGTVRRMALGAVVGGGVTALTTDQQESNNFMTAVLKGAIVGAAIGGATRVITPAHYGGKFHAPLLPKMMRAVGYQPSFTRLMKHGVSIVSAGVRTGLNVMEFSMKHPYLTAGIAGAAAYTMLGNKGPYSPPEENVQLRSTYNQELRTLEMMGNGIAPQGGITSRTAIRNNSLMQSTYGLVQGMYSSRHG